jgi:hypothetical protein
MTILWRTDDADLIAERLDRDSFVPTRTLALRGLQVVMVPACLLTALGRLGATKVTMTTIGPAQMFLDVTNFGSTIAMTVSSVALPTPYCGRGSAKGSALHNAIPRRQR